MPQSNASQNPPVLSPRELSEVLVKARRNYDAFSEFPAKLPETLAECYQVQTLSRESWEDEVVGWKVGGVPLPYQEKFQETRLTGPIFANNVKTLAAGGKVDMPAFPKGFAAVEPEFIIQLKDTAHLPDTELSYDQVVAVIDRVYIGIELASSPLYDVNKIGPAAIICDLGINWGMIIGPEIKDWQNVDLSAIEVVVDIDGVEHGRGYARQGLLGPFGAVKFLIEHQKKMGYTMAAGTYVSSGAITGVHDMDIGSRSNVSFAGLGDLDMGLIMPQR